jgi:hypothetical protein
MKEYQRNIIKEYVSTALISDDPETYLQAAIENLFQYLNAEQVENELDTLFKSEKTIQIR